MQYVGLNMGEIRRKNRASILTYINENGPSSRKEMAEATKLTPSAISQMTRTMITDGLLDEVGRVLEEGVGRKQVLVDINYDYRLIVAINIEPDWTTIALANLRGDARKHVTISTRKDHPQSFMKEIAKHCRQMIQDETISVVGASVGITGIVDVESGTSIHAYGIWDQEVEVCKLLEAELAIPVTIENNVKSFALAELLYGYGRQYNNLMVLKWGPGVGSTLIVNKEIYGGRHGKAGEIGHMIVEKNGRLCTCGRHGCLETKVSYQAMQEICSFAPEDFSKVYTEAVESHSADKFNEKIDILAQTLVNSMTIISPNRVVLCGSMFRSQLIRQRLIEAVKEYDSSYDEAKIFYTDLADREDYIGPVANFVHYGLAYGDIL